MLITGSTGFVGSWLARELVRRGATVCGLASGERAASPVFDEVAGRVQLVRGQVEDLELVRRLVTDARPAVVLHLAARARAGSAASAAAATFESNVRGTWTVLEACRSAPGLEAIVVASSAAVYRSAPGPFHEDDPIEGEGLYGVSKACADALARAFHRAHGLPVAVLRSVNVFGGGDLDWSRIVPSVVRSVWHGRAPGIRSQGTQRAEYLHVRDAVAGWLALAEAMRDPAVHGKAYNLGTSMPFSTLELVREILRVMGSEELAPRVGGEPSGRDRRLDTERLRELVGWRPRLSLHQGLVETVAWYVRYFESAAAEGIPPARTNTGGSPGPA